MAFPGNERRCWHQTKHQPPIQDYDYDGDQNRSQAAIVPSPGDEVAEIPEHKAAGTDMEGSAASQPHTRSAQEDDYHRDFPKYSLALKRHKSPQHGQRDCIREQVSEPPVQERAKGDSSQSQ